MVEQHDEPGDPVPTRGGEAPLAFEHLGWQPSWRERVEGVLTTVPPGRLAGGATAAVAVVVVAAVVLLRGPAPPPPELALPLAGAAGGPSTSSTTMGTTSSTTPAEVVVHAAGALGSPGVYRLAAGARVSDLLDAAGGPLPGADLDRLNLAAPLVDGDRVFVPLPGQEVPALVPSSVGSGAGPRGEGGAAALRPDAPLDLNRATLDELDELPGVGPSTAQAIVDERERRGGFTAVDQLLEVRGIGDAKLAALRELVRV